MIAIIVLVALAIVVGIVVGFGYYGRREPVFRRRVSHCSVVG